MALASLGFSFGNNVSSGAGNGDQFGGKFQGSPITVAGNLSGKSSSGLYVASAVVAGVVWFISKKKKR